MPYTTQSEQIAFFNGSMPIPRCLPIDGHPHREMLGNTSEIYEAKQVEREKLIRVMVDWVDKLSKQPKCVWESDKQRETLKELKRFKRNPEVAVPELKKSYYGCLHLIKEWDYLKQVVNADAFSGDFKTSDETLILGLCEVPFWNRDENFAFMPSIEMTPEEAHAHIAPFIQEKIDSLRELSVARRAEEERERELATASPEFFPDKKLRAWAKDLRKFERELIAIFTYVQSLVNPEAKSVVAPSAETVQVAQLKENRTNPPAVLIAPNPPKKQPECAPPPQPQSHVFKVESSKPALAPRLTPPGQSKTVDKMTRSQARKLRFRDAARQKGLREVSELIDARSAHTTMLPITIGKSWF